MRLCFLSILLLVVFGAFSQEAKNDYVAIDYFYGSIIKHNKTVSHLIHEHPEGVMLSYNVRTIGEKRWEQEYNYPDWGISFLYEDFKYSVLGKNYSLGFHYNFYFLNRTLQFRVGQGLNYNTNPFNLQDNFKNPAYGSHITGFSQIGMQYVKPRLFANFGIRAGILLIHHSNGGVKSPNAGTNLFSTSIGVTYDFAEKEVAYKEKVAYEKYKEPFKFNIVVRGGVNESDYVRLGQHPFYVISGFVDKKISFKNTLQFGFDFMVSEFIRKENEYKAAVFPLRNIDPDLDHRRLGVFVGHELGFNKVAIPFHVGFYLYNPSNFGDVSYLRTGVKYYINDKWYGVGTVKTHGFNAETIEFGLGIRL